MKKAAFVLVAACLAGCHSTPTPNADKKKSASADQNVAPQGLPHSLSAHPIQSTKRTESPLSLNSQQALVAAQQAGTTTFKGVVMTIPYRIVVGKDLDQSTKRTAETLIAETFDETDRLFNKFNPKSEISRLNRLPAGVEAPISLELERFLLDTEQIVELTEGRFDPTVLPLYDLWREAMERGERPAQDQVDELTAAVGWDKIHFGNGRFRKDNDLTSMDLGGVAKGHCIDQLVERLTSAGFKDVYVEWGGEIRTAGQHPDGRPWRVFISRLGDADPANAIATVEMREQALATSGDYHQYWKVPNGRSGVDTYFHIINPLTGQPMKVAPQSVASVSVLAPNCMLADGLATAAMIFDTPEKAQAFAKGIQRRIQGTAFWVLNRQMSAHQDDVQR